MEESIKVQHQAQHELDARGLTCPEPVMLLHGKIRVMAAGEVVKILATDPSTQRDLARFCRFLGHEMLASVEQQGVFIYWLRKSASTLNQQ
jgi:tRNA 2-thiouridine synthesizing protein A